METKLDEIADGIYRLSTCVPEVHPPAGFTFNQFLIAADEPLLFHTGPRGMFPLVAEAVAKVVAVESVRWITFGHVEADECGSMNMWLTAAPQSQVAHGALGCMVSLNDMCDRPPRGLVDGEVIDLGGKRVRHIDTPHVPHGWEARVLFEETTGTLLCGDLFSHLGCLAQQSPPLPRLPLPIPQLPLRVQIPTRSHSLSAKAWHRRQRPPLRLPAKSKPRSPCPSLMTGRIRSPCSHRPR